ncbi:hypothetical protein BY996DRAFT_6425999 [Phakopsora pachyrhizi]|nr:hypothetical protein BY996DRAFT_8531490 [Phakopsora pachyrhizi]KAI8444361.1 hypothetical protein BY996DRAFT_6425999 [Phakopsora pachyrhizi]
MKVPMIYHWSIALLALFPGSLKARLLFGNPSSHQESNKKIFYCTPPINQGFKEIYKHLPINENPDPSTYVKSTISVGTEISGNEFVDGGRKLLSSTSQAQDDTKHLKYLIAKNIYSRGDIEMLLGHYNGNLKKMFMKYTRESQSHSILKYLLEFRSAANNLAAVIFSDGVLKADIARIICDHQANIKHEEKDIFEFIGWMHFISKLIDIGEVNRITPNTFAADIAFHVGLLSLKQKFKWDPDRTTIITTLLSILDERRQHTMQDENFVMQFFQEYNEKLPWMRDSTLSSKIEFDKNLNNLVDGISASLREKNPKYAKIIRKIQEISIIAQASSTSSVQSKIAALVSLYSFSTVYELKEKVMEALKKIMHDLEGDPQLQKLATGLISTLKT